MLQSHIRVNLTCLTGVSCSHIAKFHYTDTDTDFFAAKLRWVRAGPFRRKKVRVVEFSSYPTTCADFNSNSNKCIAVRKFATPLRELTCHMGSHSVTCHPAEVTFPPLPQPKLVLD